MRMLSSVNNSWNFILNYGIPSIPMVSDVHLSSPMVGDVPPTEFDHNVERVVSKQDVPNSPNLRTHASVKTKLYKMYKITRRIL